MTASHSARWALGTVALVVLMAGLALAVWPTRYRFEHVNGTLVRIERASGRAAVLDADRGWVIVPDDTLAGRPNPFDGLPDLPDTVTAPPPGRAASARSP